MVGLMQPMTETMMLTGLMQPMTDVKELWGTIAIAMIMKGASIKIMMRAMGKSSDYYDDSDDNGDVVGADPAGGWVTICMNLCMYICMHICNYTYTIVYNVHAWTYVHVHRCVHDGGYMHGEG